MTEDSPLPNPSPEYAGPIVGARSNVLDDALARVRALAPALAQTLTREVDALRRGRKFGLLFEKHLPETVRLPGHPVKRGLKVAPRHQAKGQEGVAWRVLKVTGAGVERVAHLAGASEPVPVSDLVVVRDFGEPVYPGLKSVERIERGVPTDRTHVVINGENHHVLQALRMTSRKAIDLIYIDPPYNTGNEGWIYSDRYVAGQDAYKHSKWLSFMERRLTIARDLLKVTGVIIVAIGDDEHHRLRMLMDQVFGPQNFISNVVWQGGRKNDSRYVSNGADYMLIYARDEAALAERGIRWRERRKAYNEMLAAGKRCWDESGHEPETATRLMKEWIRSLPEGHEAKLNNRFYEFDPGTGRVFRKKDISWPGGGGPRYDVLHPVTGKPVRVPSRGWIYADSATMQEEIAAGRVLFGPDHNHYINRKLYLDEADSLAAESVFFQKRTSAGKRLQAILGDKRFPFPKDHEVLMRWIRLAAPTDAIVLDFFGGSGTTTEAVMRLNAEDGGTRQSILVTNNEVSAIDAKALRKAGYNPGDRAWEEKGVCRYVTQPRISTVVTGTRPDRSAYATGLGANVEFFDLIYLDPDRVSRAREFEAVAPLLWMRAGSVGKCIDKEPSDGWALTETYAVLTVVDACEPFLDALSSLDNPPQLVFVVTDSSSDFEAIAGRLPAGCRPYQLYESYMRNFEINVEAAL